MKGRGVFNSLGREIATHKRRSPRKRSEPRKRGRPPGSGRKKGSRSVLGYAERQSIDLAKRACEKFGEDDPVVVELLGYLVSIARGDPGWRGRHISDRRQAVNHILDRRLGKPVQPVSHSGKVGFTLEELLAGDVDAPDDRAK